MVKLTDIAPQKIVDAPRRLLSKLTGRLTSVEPAPLILPPYYSGGWSYTKTFFIVSSLLLFCFVYGFFFSVIAPYLFVLLISPLILVALLVIWVLPDTIRAPTGALKWFFYAMFISLAVWPNYLAIALPGLPWITMIRLTSFPLALLLLVCLSVSAGFRRQLTDTFRALPAVPILLGIFVFLQLASIGMSSEMGGSAQKFIVAQTTWTVSFIVAAYLFLRTREIQRWAMIFWALGFFVSILSIWEYEVKHVLWLGHIPAFLKVEDESVQYILAGSMRAGTTRYRSQATFSTPLGLAEFIALSLPFTLHFLTTRFSSRIRIAALASLPVLLLGCFLTDSKLGTVGCLVGIVLYGFAVAFQNWRKNKQSLFAAAFVFSYPAALCTVVAALMFVGRFRRIILGDSSHSSSTDARYTQYIMGFEKMIQWPFGYGIGRGGATLDFGTAAGFTSIDTYYLSIALEYGVIGFIVYYGMFAVAIFEGGRRSLLTQFRNTDRSFLLPIVVSLTVFVIVKSVFSQQENHPVVFMMLGAMVALIATYRQVPKSRTGISDYGASQR
jgi:hypothetical protein